MASKKKKNASQNNSNKNAVNENTKKQEGIKRSEEESNKKIEQEKSQVKQETKQETKQKQATSQNQNNEQEQTTQKNEKRQLTKNEIKAMQEVVAKEMKAKKKMPEAELNKINTKVFQNICLAIIMMFYFNFVILGFINIENSVFLVDLKVFSIVILAIAIGVFEYAYKKDSGRHAIHGIEVLVMALITISLIYVNIMHIDKFIVITVMITYIFTIYYITKAIVIYKKMKKQYLIDNMKEIIKNKKKYK